MPVAYIMVGVPGSGKSTLVHRIIRDMGDHGDRAFVYSTDNLIEEWSKGQGWTYNFGFAKYINKATQEMNSRLNLAMQENRDIIWDQTNLSAKKRKTLIDQLKKQYTVECHSVTLPAGDSQNEDWQYRLESRPGKTIPDNIIASMVNSYTKPSLTEGFSAVYHYDMYGNSLAKET